MKAPATADLLVLLRIKKINDSIRAQMAINKAHLKFIKFSPVPARKPNVIPLRKRIIELCDGTLVFDTLEIRLKRPLVRSPPFWPMFLISTTAPAIPTNDSCHRWVMFKKL